MTPTVCYRACANPLYSRHRQAMPVYVYTECGIFVEYKVYEFIRLPFRKSELRIFRKVGNAEKQNARNDKMFSTSRTREATKQMWKILRKHKIGFLEVKYGKYHKPKKTTKTKHVLVLSEMKYQNTKEQKNNSSGLVVFSTFTQKQYFGTLVGQIGKRKKKKQKNTNILGLLEVKN